MPAPYQGASKVQGTVKQGKPCSDVGDTGSAGTVDALDYMGCGNKHVKPITMNKKE